MSTDDIVALLYVASSLTFDLKAVTVSGTGLTACPTGARHALQLLAVAGRTDVPVACGRAEPLAGANQFQVEWRARADAFFGLELPPAARKPGGKRGRSARRPRRAQEGRDAPLARAPDRHGGAAARTSGALGSGTKAISCTAGDSTSRVATVTLVGAR